VWRDPNHKDGGKVREGGITRRKFFGPGALVIRQKAQPVSFDLGQTQTLDRLFAGRECVRSLFAFTSDALLMGDRQFFEHRGALNLGSFPAGIKEFGRQSPGNLPIGLGQAVG
jgi:hypothetical protein